jgi:hypothetical protein
LRARARKSLPAGGGHDVGEATTLADLAREQSRAPAGCAWLDYRTIEDLDLAAVFGTIDRTRTAIGAQVLWQWLTAPADDLDVLATREREISVLSDAALRERTTTALGTTSHGDAPHVTRLLWGPPSAALHRFLVPALMGVLLVCLIAMLWWPPALLGVVLVFGANLIVDDWSKLRLAHQTRSLELLDGLLGRAALVASLVPETLGSRIRGDLEVRHGLHRRLWINQIKDPFEFLDLVRAGTLARLATARSAMRFVETERERLRRIVLWFGEIDGLAAVASLRAERSEWSVPELVADEASIHAGNLAHPTVDNAIGNDVDLVGGLLVTGSNMSGKSTFLRTVAVNAILAQSIHTTLGAWRAPPLRVRCVMRIADDPARGMSTYAVEVAAMGLLVSPSERTASRSLFVVDEPFNGTNPTIRVPIVVAVLEYLVGNGLVVAATHDLDVATRLDGRFARVYFEEQAGGVFDRHLRSGIAPATNAVEILHRAGYPAAILDRLR